MKEGNLQYIKNFTLVQNLYLQHSIEIIFYITLEKDS